MALRPIRTLSPDVREQLLREAWLRHDALWFEAVLNHVGEEGTNATNRAVVERLAEYEMLSLVRRLRVDTDGLDSYAVKQLFDIGTDLYQTRLSPVTIETLDGDRLRVVMKNCWACKSIREAGLLEQYRCGPWARLKGWLKALNITSQIEPDPDRCLALDNECASLECRVEFHIPFPSDR